MVCARAGAAKPSRQASDSSVAPSRLLAEGAASAKRVFVVSMLVSLEWWWREDRMIHDARFHHPSTSGDDDLRLAEVRTLLVGGGTFRVLDGDVDDDRRVMGQRPSALHALEHPLHLV